VVSYSAWRWEPDRHELSFKDRQAGSFLFAAATGELTHSWPGVSPVIPADCNSDGLVDLVGIQVSDKSTSPWRPVGGSLHVLRGTPPEPWRRPGLWQPAAGGKYPRGMGALTLTPPAVQKVTGDSRPDWLVFRPSGDLFGREGPALGAYSGNDGRLLWQTTLAGNPGQSPIIHECPLLDCRVLDSTGLIGVCCTYLVGPPGNPEELWLAMLSGRTGQVLWKDHLSGFYYDASSSRSPARRIEKILWADVNGDGNLSLIYLAQTRKEFSESHELRARDARDGRLLWKRATSPSWMAFRPGTKEGGTLLLANPEDPGKKTIKSQVELLRGRDGQTLWTWQIPEGFFFGAVSNYVENTAPVALFADFEGHGSPAICVPLRRAQGALVQILDYQGKPLKTLPYAPPTPPEDARDPHKHRERWLAARLLRLWSADLKGDGKDELVFLSEGQVQVYSDGLEKPRWQWPVPDPLTAIVDILPAGPNQAGIIFVQAQSTVYGLDAVTGKLRCKCEGPGHAVAVIPGQAGVPPQIWFQDLEPAVTVCRYAWPVDKDGKYEEGPPVAIRPGPPPLDWWKMLPLPWVHDGRQHFAAGWFLATVGLALVAAFAWKRRWRMTLVLLGCFFLIPLAVGAVEIMEIREFRLRKHPEQELAWDGWPLLWPYTFFTPWGWALLRSPLLWMGLLAIGLRVRAHYKQKQRSRAG
jgi:outer membrane protein assembly factor BamB